jgi:hypothetical protein
MGVRRINIQTQTFEEWLVRGCTILHAAVNSRQCAIAQSDGHVVYFELNDAKVWNLDASRYCAEAFHDIKRGGLFLLEQNDLVEMITHRVGDVLGLHLPSIPSGHHKARFMVWVIAFYALTTCSQGLYLINVTPVVFAPVCRRASSCKCPLLAI